MRILFVTAHSYLPDRVGGSEQSIHELCLELAARGVETAVLCSRLGKPDDGSPIVRDQFGGYTVYRAARVGAAVAPVVSEYKPDIAVVQTGRIAHIVNNFLHARVPTAIYFRDVEFSNFGGDLIPTDRLLFLANSRFTTERVRLMYGG